MQDFDEYKPRRRRVPVGAVKINYSDIVPGNNSVLGQGFFFAERATNKTDWLVEGASSDQFAIAPGRSFHFSNGWVIPTKRMLAKTPPAKAVNANTPAPLIFSGIRFQQREGVVFARTGYEYFACLGGNVAVSETTFEDPVLCGAVSEKKRSEIYGGDAIFIVTYGEGPIIYMRPWVSKAQVEEWIRSEGFRRELREAYVAMRKTFRDRPFLPIRSQGSKQLLMADNEMIARLSDVITHLGGIVRHDGWKIHITSKGVGFRAEAYRSIPKATSGREFGPPEQMVAPVNLAEVLRLGIVERALAEHFTPPIAKLRVTPKLQPVTPTVLTYSAQAA